MTDEWYKEKHREKWRRIIEEFKNGNLKPLYELEPDVLDSMRENPIHYSFACEFSAEQCDFCPIVNKCGVCRYKGSIQDRLYKAIDDGNQAEAIRFAKIIKDAWE